MKQMKLLTGRSLSVPVANMELLGRNDDEHDVDISPKLSKIYRYIGDHI